MTEAAEGNRQRELRLVDGRVMLTKDAVDNGREASTEKLNNRVAPTKIHNAGCSEEDRMTQKRSVNRSATERLAQIVRAELARQELTAEEAARAARLPAKAFRSLLRHGHRPSVDRADELCRALGITMTIGGKPETVNARPVDGASGQGQRFDAGPVGVRSSDGQTAHRFRSDPD